MISLKTLHKHHRWVGLAVCFFLAMLCVSGVLLNHRDWIRDCEVSRQWLPPMYDFENWNGGLMRGTVPLGGDSVIIYGVNGMWLTDTSTKAVCDFNAGLPAGADHRAIRRVVRASDGRLYAAAQYGLYRYDGQWRHIDIGLGEDDRLTDIEAAGDTLVVISRSHAYASVSPFAHFRRIEIKAPDGYQPKATLFRTVWLLHSGELYGQWGKFVVDLIAVILIALTLTGLAFFILRKHINRRVKNGVVADRPRHWLKGTLWFHNKAGRWTIVLTLFIAVTGWCLRPPVMVPLAMTKTRPLPGSILDNDNPWHDKLRLIRHDDAHGDWLLSTSEGFLGLDSLNATPRLLKHTPPVSVMGLNVWERDERGQWLCGSFSGLFRWHRDKGQATDYFTGQAAPETSGPPFGKRAVSGFSADLTPTPLVAEYYEGTDRYPQPPELRELPMSLWNVALEIHSGRIFIGSVATYIFIFIIGLAVIWTLYTGYRLKK